MHESPVSGHPGHLKMLYLLKERFYWRGMAAMTKQFIDGCAVCQQMKTNTHPTAAPLMPIKSHAHRPFQQVKMDFITDLPISNGFDSIFIVVDQGLSKGVILCPCNKMIDAEGTIKLYIDNVFIQYGLPDIIISDRGPQFASNVFNGIFDAIGVKHRMSTAYHPQTDGQTECYNQELEAYLRIYCAYKPDEWSNKLSLAQFAHNARTHEAIKQSPFQLMYGTKPVALPEVSEKTNSPVANNRINQLCKSREEALAAHDLARIKMMERTTNRTKPFKVNDQVWLESKNLKIPYQSRKLTPKREGPFKIKEVLGPVTYRLTLPKQWKIHDVFQEQKLRELWHLYQMYYETKSIVDRFDRYLLDKHKPAIRALAILNPVRRSMTELITSPHLQDSLSHMMISTDSPDSGACSKMTDSPSLPPNKPEDSSTGNAPI
jgi:hypothetical protein